MEFPVAEHLGKSRLRILRNLEHPRQFICAGHRLGDHGPAGNQRSSAGPGKRRCSEHDHRSQQREQYFESNPAAEVAFHRFGAVKVSVVQASQPIPSQAVPSFAPTTVFIAGMTKDAFRN
jgi:hypothetical protein